MRGKKDVTLILTIAILLAFIVRSAPALAGEETKRFASPTGRFAVTFTEIGHKKFPKNVTRGLDEIDHVVYRIDLRAKGTKERAASVVFNDVYGWEEGGMPASEEALFRLLVWSPEDDFVIIPTESWASAPGTAIAKAVALESKLRWKEAEFAFDKFIWTDSLNGVGDAHFDCDYSVSRFDGRTGRTIPVKESKSPVGYELISVEGDNAFVRETLDNCGTDYAEPLCFTVGLYTGNETPRPCPAEDKKPDGQGEKRR